MRRETSRFDAPIGKVPSRLNLRLMQWAGHRWNHIAANASGIGRICQRKKLSVNRSGVAVKKTADGEDLLPAV
jgi:hypothetical protein